MDLHQLRAALLKISLVVLAGSSWIFSSFIMESRPDEEELDVDPLTSLVRLPASLPGQLPQTLPDVFAPQVKVSEPVRMDVVRLPCWDIQDQRAQEIPSRWIRLVGKTCENETASDAITVKNLANGYVATVFTAGRGKLMTDFIPLESGANEILIRLQPEAGVSVENQITFNR